ncbi:TonB-dependent receptor [Pseudoalteromonas denitrificans]|uniref:Iron complex outermembrane recepter protein n=1 Tax=Pseudoalteromonas denitrificans DSM 6059 TaxID=1123010 RepID=A0A1I1Q9Q0_9GAMM|nr:TonB-dependent receptor [Pseudoalteromonas denitrificans]SFD18795.1 iron complex outermembrane recepter protein [Pseudoalteromonas denitrificans DSM 6059]
MFKTSFSLLAILVATNLSANTQISSTEEDLERIIVTGSRIVENIDEVPASITVITRQQIEEQLKVSTELQNLLSTLVPGMAPSTGTSSNSTQTLRGRAPLVMIDGVPQSTPLRNGSLGIRTLDASAIERIEVIKGATSVYGNGAAGGIINYITKKATSTQALTGEAGFSTRFSAVKLKDSAGSRFNSAINGQINNFNYVVSASYEENGVQRDAEGDIIGLKYGLSDSNTENYFTKLGYEFSQDKTIQFAYNYYKSQQESDLIDVVGNINTGIKTHAIKAPLGTVMPGVPQGPRGNHNVMLKYTDAEIFYNTQLTLDAYSQKIENVFFYSPVLSNPSEGFDGGQSLIKSKKKGLRLTFNSQLDWHKVEGTFIYGIDALNDVSSQPMVDGRIWVPEMDMKNLAGFVQTKWVLNDEFVIKAGLRKENIDLSVDDFNTLKLCTDSDTCSVPFSVKGDTLKYDATTYNFAIKYNFFDAFSPFMSYSQGADISDIGRLLRTATVTDIADVQTQASIINNYELGFDSEFDNLRIEFSIYRSTSELGTTNKLDPQTGIYLPVRAPQKIWGYEGLLSYRINSDLNLNATYSLVEGKNTEADVYLGAKQISAPKGTMNLQWQASDNINLSLTYLYVGNRKRFDADENGNYAGDKGPINNYSIFNVSANYNINQWSVFSGIENLFNQDYYSARSQGYTYNGYNTKSLGTTITAGIKYHF